MGKEQREFERAELHLPIQYRPAGGFASLWQQGTLVNISATGLRLAARGMLELEAKVEVALTLPIRSTPYMFSGTVASEHVQPGQHEYGVVFVDVTPEKSEEIDELVRFLNRVDE